MVNCVADTNRNLIIVSRDADYGITVEGSSFANDALSQELKERVNQQRKIILCDRLSAALKVLKIEVTQAEEEQDLEIAKKAESDRALQSPVMPPEETSTRGPTPPVPQCESHLG